MSKKPTIKPTQKPVDANKMKIGQIDSTHLTVMFTKGDAHKFLFALVDKHLFSTNCLEHIINLIHRCNRTQMLIRKFLLICFGGISPFGTIC